jgi:hypothetical protein
MVPASGAGLFRVATMGSTTAGYGMVDLRGTIGDLYNPMYVDLSVLTRGGLKVFGTVEGTAAGATKCDLGVRRQRRRRLRPLHLRPERGLHRL